MIRLSLTVRAHSQSTLFSGSPSNYVQLRFNALPAESATARFNFTLLHFRQNGTKADGTTPIYYRTAAVPIGVQAPTLVTGTQIYTLMLDLPASLNCGNPAGRSRGSTMSSESDEGEGWHACALVGAAAADWLLAFASRSASRSDRFPVCLPQWVLIGACSATCTTTRRRRRRRTRACRART